MIDQINILSISVYKQKLLSLVMLNCLMFIDNQIRNKKKTLFNL